MGKYKGGNKRVLFDIQNCGFNTPAAVLNSTYHITVVAVVELKKGRMM